MRYLILVLSILLVMAHTAAAQEKSLITCESVLVSPEGNTDFISSNSVATNEDGQLVYLIERDGDFEADVIHVSADDSVKNLGTISVYQVVFGNPQWVVDFERGSIIYRSIQLDTPAVFGIEHIDITTGEHTTLMEDVSEFGIGQLDDLVWWNTKTATAFHDPESGETTTIDFAGNPFDVTPVRMLEDGDVLFGARNIADDFHREFFYRGSLETSDSSLLHDDEIADNHSSIAENGLVLDDRILYINLDGVLKEIDFEGNVLRSVELQGPGRYYDIQLTKEGVIYTFHNLDNSANAIYTVMGDTVTQLTPDSLNAYFFNGDLTVITDAAGEEQVWFTSNERANPENSVLRVLSLPEGKELFTLDITSTLELSPERNYVIVNQNGTTAIVVPDTFEVITELGVFDGNFHFSEGEAQFFFTVDDEVYAYDFETGERELLLASQHHYPNAFFVDDENQLVYLYESQSPEMSGFMSRMVSVTTLEGDEAVSVTPPDFQLAFDMHARGFLPVAPNDLVYFEQGWQRMFRARCSN